MLFLTAEKDLARWPSAPMAIEQIVGGHIEPTTPFTCGQSQPVVFDVSALPCILILLRGCSPSAIAWLVIAFVVNPVDAQACLIWAAPHVGQEILEGHPSFANRNAAPGIQGIITAAGLHAMPDSVFDSSTQTMLPEAFTANTSATPDSQDAQIECFNGGRLPAIANAIPVSSFAASITSPENCEPSEPLPGYINQFHGEILRRVEQMGT